MPCIQILPEVFSFLERQHGQFIDGQTRAPASGAAMLSVTNPATESVIAQVAAASEAEVDAAVAAATAAFEGVWAQTSPYERGQLLLRMADAMEAHGEELAQIESLTTGKSIHLSRMLDVGQTAVALRYYAGWATKISGQTLSPSFPSLRGERYSAMTLREPVGVVAGIIPWNFGPMIAAWKFGAALACGCTMVLKPSEFSPLTLLRMVELFTGAGLPDGVLNIVNGGGDCGQQLIHHPDVAKVSFTGSAGTGIKVGRAAVAAHLTRFTLELGGKNAAILLADANVDAAVTGLLQTGYVHQGQVCAAPERLFVSQERVDEVCEKMAQALRHLKIGSPLDEAVQQGPISNKPQYEKVLQYFETAHRQSQVLCGARAVDGTGYFVEPTLIRARTPQDVLLCEEVFGPVLTVMPYEDEGQMLEWVNDTPFGLSASLWTNDLAKAMRLIPQVQAGTVWVNMHTFLDCAVPFGGVKASGVGRELGSAFIDDYTELKSVIMAY
ncbi:aldehyde dehydrogenase [Lampropedia cohaerens]|uniref:4-(hydroxymethyl)benzenesulfonate dehydrogenase n=1 Tax=Lampropedia cohaerens TaxID=1610491 RepID=A0A0U1Q3K4_9BURK|nr:aldehyde dehydrogenase family protein [Lampropedia cohaerens]KKW69326.1 aldehyde dehydrogenase [Lampropedia cohaerens]